jgi:transcriptional regulator with XRE-family HTH domain
VKQPRTPSKLRDARVAAGLTQAQLAKATMTSTTTIIRAEGSDRGLEGSNAVFLKRWAAVLGVTMESLMPDIERIHREVDARSAAMRQRAQP